MVQYWHHIMLMVQLDTNTKISVQAFNHLMGMKYQDEENLIEYYQNTRVVEFKAILLCTENQCWVKINLVVKRKCPLCCWSGTNDRVGNKGPRTPGVGEVFPYQDWLDNVNNSEAPRMSGVGGLLCDLWVWAVCCPSRCGSCKYGREIAPSEAKMTWVTTGHGYLEWEETCPSRCDLEWEGECPSRSEDLWVHRLGQLVKDDRVA